MKRLFIVFLFLSLSVQGQLVSIISGAKTGGAVANLLEFDVTNTTITAGAMTNVIGGDWSVVRNSVATYYNPAKLIVEVAANIARIQNGSVFIEPTDDNFVGRSENLDTNWIQTRLTVVDSAIDSPDGLSKFREFECTTASSFGAYSLKFYNNAPNINKVFSVYVENLTSSAEALVISHSGNNLIAYFDTANGVIGTFDDSQGSDFTYVSHDIELITGNIYRLQLVFQDSQNAISNEFRLYVIDALDALPVTIGTKSSYWGAMVSKTYSSYIPTRNNAPEVREADVITILVPVGATNSETFINNVSQGVVGVTPGNTFTMVDGTTRIIMY